MNRTDIDDYELPDKDFDEFIRRGMEELRWEAEQERKHHSHHIGYYRGRK